MPDALRRRVRRPALARRLLLPGLALVLALGAAAGPAAGSAGPQAGGRLVVSAEGPYTTIAAALANARPGDVVEVHPGTYAGPVVVTTENVTLEGVDWPVIDGNGQGTVVTLAAPGAAVRGFEVRGSGVEPERDHGGITLSAPRTVAEGNRLRDVLFGIFVAHADDSVVRGNDISSKPENELGAKGDGIRLWYSRRVLVEANLVHEARDLVAWYAEGIVLRNNEVRNGRYGIHLMYCDGAQVEANRFYGNSVGIYTMYSNNIVLRDNDLRGQRGPSGYALGFKDADNVLATSNILADNRAGMYLDNTPFSPQGYARFESNTIAFNDVGVIVLPAVRGAVLSGNTFWENVEQVAVQGGGLLGANDWSGNYWSDYTGFDAAGPLGAGRPDGVGDVPYRSERLFEHLMDREPGLRALLYSPAVDAIEMAAAAFPVVRPQPKFEDPTPLVAPLPLPTWAASRAPAAHSALPGGVTPAALVLVGLSLAIGALALVQGEHPMQAGQEHAPAAPTAAASAAAPEPTVRVIKVSKRYGKLQALDGVSFDARAGEAVALWGANGAGKTTLMKAILGLIDFGGQITVASHDARRAGKLARRAIGYVPQEAIFYDLSVQATMAFYARLKGVDRARIGPLLARLGLAPHARKPVPALSGGLKQRLALAIALLADPPVLLLDEPTANLDAQAQRDYLELLASLRKAEGKTIIFASHRLEEVEAVANRVLVLEYGRLVDTVTPVELLARLMPEIELALWVPEAQRSEAVACLAGAGWPAHANGRGTVVVRVRTEHKLRPLQALQEHGIVVSDFEMTRGAPWS